MKIYTVHIKEGNKPSLEEAIFVKEGFSFRAAVFHLFWALYNKMWLFALVFFAVSVGFVLLEKYAIISHQAVLILQVGFFVFIGFIANDWRRYSLSINNFIVFDIVSGTNFADAQRRFFDSYAKEISG